MEKCIIASQSVYIYICVKLYTYVIAILLKWRHWSQSWSMFTSGWSMSATFMLKKAVPVDRATLALGQSQVAANHSMTQWSMPCHCQDCKNPTNTLYWEDSSLALACPGWTYLSVKRKPKWLGTWHMSESSTHRLDMKMDLQAPATVEPRIWVLWPGQCFKATNPWYKCASHDKQNV